MEEGRYFATTDKNFVFVIPFSCSCLFSDHSDSCSIRVGGVRVEGEEAKSYDGKNAWHSINHSILSDLSNPCPTEPTQLIICRGQPQVIYVWIAFAGLKHLQNFQFVKKIKMLNLSELLCYTFTPLDECYCK